MQEGIHLLLATQIDDSSVIDAPAQLSGTLSEDVMAQHTAIDTVRQAVATWEGDGRGW